MGLLEQIFRKVYLSWDEEYCISYIFFCNKNFSTSLMGKDI